jgi:hypothetical protein
MLDSLKYPSFLWLGTECGDVDIQEIANVTKHCSGGLDISFRVFFFSFFFIRREVSYGALDDGQGKTFWKRGKLNCLNLCTPGWGFWDWRV